jgi:hypothetical protein
MKPGHLNVFDGLRITTEHINYLQGSFHSAVEDIREILGLGAVYSGFDVVAEGNSIRVSPGLAFDFQKNRIACDESKTLEATFGPGETTKYVCIKYDQVEDGEVEGRFTLVWDSCAIELRPELPAENENVLAIAKIENGSGGLQVSKLDVATSNADIEPAEEIPPPPVEASETEPQEEPAAPLPAIATTPEPEPESTAAINVRQGVTRLAAVEGREKLTSAAIIESLFRTESVTTDTTGLSLLLSEVDVPLGFSLLSLSCQTIASGNFTVEAETGSSTFSTTAHGEVTAGEDGTTQFGISTTQVSSSQPAIPELTEVGIAHLPLRLLGQSSSDEKAGVLKMLAFLEWIIEVPTAGDSGFKISCSLRRRGAVTNDEIKEFQNGLALFEWEALVAWKALGESRL